MRVGAVVEGNVLRRGCAWSLCAGCCLGSDRLLGTRCKVHAMHYIIRLRGLENIREGTFRVSFVLRQTMVCSNRLSRLSLAAAAAALVPLKMRRCRSFYSKHDPLLNGTHSLSSTD
ncbi:uncharacterized protein [Physcomitrium patens]|uniref:uncharacterized protein n=1 Tax=Physcomitrium patens TaxID=3218 RepID=UPI003CCCADD1